MVSNALFSRNLSSDVRLVVGVLTLDASMLDCKSFNDIKIDKSCLLKGGPSGI